MGNSKSSNKKNIRFNKIYKINNNWDQNSIENLIKNKKISPIFKNFEIFDLNLDECPICFYVFF
jgi:hypothetical protein